MKHIPDDYMPILSIMARPRDAINYTLVHKNFAYALYAGAVGGFASSLATMYGSAYPVGFTVGQVVYAAFITGIFVVMLTNLAMAFMLNVIGSVFKGNGSFKTLFQVMCMSLVPYIWLLPILLFWLQLAPDTFFKLTGEITLGQVIVSYVGAFLILAAAVWAFVLSLVGISEAHGFSKWKAFFTLLIASVVVGLLLLVVGRMMF